MRIIINGAGIAGTTLAYWLQKSGHEVLLVEKSPQLRSTRRIGSLLAGDGTGSGSITPLTVSGYL